MNYYNKYAKLQAIKLQVEKKESEMIYKDSTYRISITPTHFNYFSMTLCLKGECIDLPIDNIRDMAKWILESTENIKDPFKIWDDIYKKEESIKGI